ncbi:MAG: MBL fold metallo-hydrolase, partial [Desulfobacteraceae bacterium]|nr:MBL fold metallo-hydrolase [Desulfobacteraceae bacterium]
MLIRQMTVGMMGVCCYLVACEETREAMLIDAGGDEDRVLALCEKEGVSLQYIVGTHGHPDHVCGNARIKEATGARIVLHEADAAFFGRPEVVQYFSMLGLAPSPPADLTVTDGDRLAVGTVSLEVIHTPGHTPGGICLYGAPNLFSGDTLFVGGIGRSDFPGGDGRQLLAAIRDRLFALPPETVVWPG